MLTPVAVTLQEEHTPDHELPRYAAKIKVRYLIDKWCEHGWVLMARVPGESESIEPLCFALGGLLRITDLVTKEETTRTYD